MYMDYFATCLACIVGVDLHKSKQRTNDILRVASKPDMHRVRGDNSFINQLPAYTDVI